MSDVTVRRMRSGIGEEFARRSGATYMADAEVLVPAVR